MPNILVVRCFQGNGSARAEAMSRKPGGDMRGPNPLSCATWLPDNPIAQTEFFGASCGYCADAQKFSDYLGNDHAVVTANRIRSGSRCIRVIATRAPIQAPHAPIATATGTTKKLHGYG